MTLVDSLDSILMLYSYTGFAGHSWRIFEPNSSPPVLANEAVIVTDQSGDAVETESKTMNNTGHDNNGNGTGREREDRIAQVKQSAMSKLSIVLTTLSILLAFRSVIEVVFRSPMRRLMLQYVAFRS